MASDSGSVSVLFLLGLSAAFDTADQNILINRLEQVGSGHICLIDFSLSM